MHTTSRALCVNVCAIRGLKFGVIGKLLSGKEVQSGRPKGEEAWKSSFDSFDSDSPSPSSPPPSSKSFSNFPPPTTGERQPVSTPGRTGAERWQEVATKRGWFRFPPSGLVPCLGQSRKILSHSLPWLGRFDFLFQSGGAAKGETGMEDLEDLRFSQRGGGGGWRIFEQRFSRFGVMDGERILVGIAVSELFLFWKKNRE